MRKNYVSFYRLEKGYNQEYLALLVGISKNSICSIEKGISNPRLDTAYKISRVLGVPVETLFPPERYI